MGLEVDRTEFEEQDYERFSQRLSQCLATLEAMLARPRFGVGATTLGAELEVSIVDDSMRPLPRNQEVCERSGDSRLTLELDRFNLESNLRFGPLAGRPFAALAEECRFTLADMERAAAHYGGRIASVGIVPTLRADDLTSHGMTDSARYRALSAGLRRLRAEPFDFDIQGDESLRVTTDDVTYEGAATSFQLHLRVDPEDFAEIYNAAQLATPVVLAVAGNSPVFLGRRLWHETRIALFKQAVDPRPGRHASGEEARVCFGTDWIASPLDLFRHNVRAHPPLLPILDGERPDASKNAVPALRELRLHQGTVWSWNRAIFDPAEGGHLRIEMRSLPSGPSVPDMIANAAFHVGLAFGLARFPRREPFDMVHDNFYRAAREGLAAELGWPTEPGAPAALWKAPDLVERLLPVAQAGLERSGVEPEDFVPLLAIIERRARTGRTGAAWQRRRLQRAEASANRWEALTAMFAAYLEQQRSGEPVDRWRDAPA